MLEPQAQKYIDIYELGCYGELNRNTINYNSRERIEKLDRFVAR